MRLQDSMRLQELERKNRKVRSCTHLFALVKRGKLLVGKARLAEKHPSRWHDRATHFAGAQTPKHKPRKLRPRKPSR